MPSLKMSRAMDRPQEVPGNRTVELRTLVGTWLNFDPTSTGIAKLVIGEDDGALVVRTYGAAEATPHDWGLVRGDAFAAGVAGGGGIGFRAEYDFGFMETTLAAYLNLRLLVVDTYNIFKDGSGRRRYFMRDHFYQP